MCGWQVKLCDPLVTRGPYLSALEIRSLYIKSYINLPSLLFTRHSPENSEETVHPICQLTVTAYQGWVQPVECNGRRTSSSLLMDVLGDRGSSTVALPLLPPPPPPPLLLLVDDLLVDDVLSRGTEVRGGTRIFGERTPSADCHAIVSGLPLYREPSDTACMTSQ